MVRATLGSTPCLYLAGPMEFAANFGAVWRRLATSELDKQGIGYIDPGDPSTPIDPTYVRLFGSTTRCVKTEVQVLARLKLTDRDAWLEVYDYLWAKNKRGIDASDALLVHMDMSPVIHRYEVGGTFREMSYAHEQHKPIYLWCDPKHPVQLFNGHFHHLVCATGGGIYTDHHLDRLISDFLRDYEPELL